jgi:hypothetical protein
MFDFRVYGKCLANRKWQIVGSLGCATASGTMFVGGDAWFGVVGFGAYVVHQFMEAANSMPPSPPRPKSTYSHSVFPA